MCYVWPNKKAVKHKTEVYNRLPVLSVVFSSFLNSKFLPSSIIRSSIFHTLTMRIATVILGALVTVAMTLPESPNEPANSLQGLAKRYSHCPCFPDCKPACPSGTGCYCIPGGGGAPCQPYCGCPEGEGGECVVSESSLYSNLT